jgi:hypothetical protein
MVFHLTKALYLYLNTDLYGSIRVNIFQLIDVVIAGLGKELDRIQNLKIYFTFN